ncbi:MAG: thioredoxin [Clostridiales bacterium]|nr:thioredoxin [Clostridiales bacterium]
MSSKKWLRILVPVLILAAAGGLYAFKNHQTQQKAAQQLALAGDPAFVMEETTFDLQAYQAHQLPIILDFGAEECGPCQVMRPDLEATHQKTLGKAIIKFFDVWKKPDLATDYPIRVVPTQVFFHADGTPYTPSDKVQAADLSFSLFDHIDTGEHSLTVHEGILNEEQFDLILADMGMVP